MTHTKVFCTQAIVIASSLLSGAAWADDGVTIAVEVGADVVVSNLSRDSSLSAGGPAVGLRLGYTFDAPMIRLTPEAKFAFESPGTPKAGALMGGARLNLLEGLSPAVFAHAGGLVGDIEGFVWDAGAGLDLTLFPVIDLGVYGAYYRAGGATMHFGNDAWANRNSYDWLQFGAQAAIHF